MAVIGTDYNHYSNLVKTSDSDNTALFHEVVTVNEAAQKSYVVGTALGKAVVLVSDWLFANLSAIRILLLRIFRFNC